MPNRKISELEEATSITSDDLLVIVDDPSGDPTSKKVTFTNLASSLSVSGAPLYPFTGYNITSDTVTISSGAITIDYTLGNAYEVVLTENITSITISNGPTSGTFGEVIIKFKQDATGGRTVTGWPNSVRWPGATAPVITTTNVTGTDIITLKTWNAGNTWFGNFSQDYTL